MTDITNVDFIVWDANGNILRSGYCQNIDLASQVGPGEFVKEGVAQDDTHYINPLTEDILIKSPMVLVSTPEGTGWDITGIPNPTIVSITSRASAPIEVEVTDGVLEYRTDVIGIHTFHFTSKEYKTEFIKETKV